jgi:hypothetical protein
MKKGDVFVLQEGEVQGYYAYWGKEENKETEMESIPQGSYYIQEENNDEYVIAEILGEGEFKLLGKKRSYYVSKEQLKDKKVIENVSNELNVTLLERLEKAEQWYNKHVKEKGFDAVLVFAKKFVPLYNEASEFFEDEKVISFADYLYFTMMADIAGEFCVIDECESYGERALHALYEAGRTRNKHTGKYIDEE